MSAQLAMFGVSLDADHYLGRRGARARLVYEDDFGMMVFAGVSSRRLPATWLELSRWCISGGKNAGSQQWRRALAWLRDRTESSTVVSYSDPSVGHSGALYRACGWIWAPTWHVLRPPPSGGGTRGGRTHSPKHRWVFPLRQDEDRVAVLALHDESLRRRFPDASYVEPTWHGPRWHADGGRYRRVTQLLTSAQEAAA